MHRTCKMTVWEAEQFLNQSSDVRRSLADAWELDSQTSFDPDVLLSTIMLKGGELGILFNNVATYYNMNLAWWKKWKPTFEHWMVVEDKEYEPLWDRNGFEKIDDTTIDDGKDTKNTENKEVMDDDTTSHLTSHTVTDTASNDDSVTTSKVSAFDAGDNLVNHDQQVFDGEGKVHTTIDAESNGAGTDDRTTTFTEEVKGTDYNKNTFDHELHSWGNWGVSEKSSSQNLYALEHKVRMQYNPYELMSEIFIKEMTDGVWI